MGFFQTIKNKLGIGGVKISINVPGQISIEGGKVAGKFTLTSKSDQEISEMEVKLIEKYTTGRGEDKTTNEFTLGNQKFNKMITIKSGNSLEHAFDFDFNMLKSNNDELAAKGGLVGGIGKLGKFASNEKSEYWVSVDVDVKAAVLDPSEEVNIKLV